MSDLYKLSILVKALTDREHVQPLIGSDFPVIFFERKNLHQFHSFYEAIVSRKYSQQNTNESK